MTRDKALQIVQELCDVLKRHDVMLEDDRWAGLCLEDKYRDTGIFDGVQYQCDDGTWKQI